nr:DNA repair protein REV1 [Salvelinus alpinus]
MAAKVSKLDEQFKLDVPREKLKDGACSSIFTGVAIYVKGYTEPSVDELRRLMMLHGGQFHVYYSHSNTTHIIATNLPNSKIQELRDQKVVRPEWITDSIKAGHLLSYLQYQLYAKQKGLSFPSVSVHQGQEPAGPLHGHLLPSHSLPLPSLNNHNPAPSRGQPLSRHHTPTSSHSHVHIDNLLDQPNQYNPLAGDLNPQPSHSLPLPSHLNPQSRHFSPGHCFLSPYSSNHLYSDPGHIPHHPPSQGQPKPGCIRPLAPADTHSQTPGPVPAHPSHEHSKPGHAQPQSSLSFSNHLQHSYRDLDFRLNGSLLTYDKTRTAQINWVQEGGGEDPCPVRPTRGATDPPLTNGHAHPVNGALKPLDLSPNPTRPTDTPLNPDRKSTGGSGSLHPASPLSNSPLKSDPPKLLNSPPRNPTPPPVSHHRHHEQLANEQRLKPPPPTYQEATAALASRPLILPPPKPRQSDSPPEKPLPLDNPNRSPSPVRLNGSHHNAFTPNPAPLETNNLSAIPSNPAPPDSDHQSALAKTGGIISEFYSHSRLHHISTWRSEFSEYVNTLQSRRRSTGGATFPGRDRLKRQRREGSSAAPGPQSCILHVDMDCFFVSVGIRHRPDLKGMHAHTHTHHLGPQPSQLGSQSRHLTLGPSLLGPFSSNHLYSDPGHITHHPPSHGQPKLDCIHPPPSAYTHPQTPGPVPANPSHEHSKPGQAQPPSVLCISSHLQHNYRELDFRLNGSLLTSYEKTRSVKMNGVQELGGEDPCPVRTPRGVKDPCPVRTPRGVKDPCPVRTPRGVKDPTLTNGHAHPVNGAIKSLDLSLNPTRPTPTPDRGLSANTFPSNPTPLETNSLSANTFPSNPTLLETNSLSANTFPSNPTPLETNSLSANPIPSNYAPPHHDQQSAKVKTGGIIAEFYCHSRLHHISTWRSEFSEYVNTLQSRRRATGGATFPGRDRLRRQRREGLSAAPGPQSCILHVDMDCFFVSVGIRHRPDLKGKSVAVTSNRGPGRVAQRPGVDHQLELQYYQKKYSYPAVSERKDGDLEEMTSSETESHISHGNSVDQDTAALSMAEIASCSYEARLAGVRNGMFFGQAKQLCPSLQSVPYDFQAYKKVSLAMYETLASYSHDIEALSCDEALVDSSALLAELSVTPDELASAIRADVRERTGCSASVGMGSNILLARMATRKAKPNGQYLLRSEEVDDFIRDQTVTSLPGVGRSMGGKLASLGVRSCGDLQQVSLQRLQKEFGPRTGQTLFRFCRGLDDRPVRSEKERKSVSAEMNYNIRFTQVDEAESFLTHLSIEVQKRLQGAGLRGRRLTLKVMVCKAGAPVEPSNYSGHGTCDNLARSVTLAQLTDCGHLIASEVIKLFHTMRLKVQDLRGVGLQVQLLEGVHSVPKDPSGPKTSIRDKLLAQRHPAQHNHTDSLSNTAITDTCTSQENSSSARVLSPFSTPRPTSPAEPIPGTSKGEPPPSTHTPNHVGTRLNLSIEVSPPSQPQRERPGKRIMADQRNPLLHLKHVGVGRMKHCYKKSANKGPSPLKRPRPPGNTPAKDLPHVLRPRDLPNVLKLENGPSTSPLQQDDPETLSKFTPRPEPTLAGACDFMDIRTLLREWVTTISDPMEEDILQVVKYCTDLINDKDLEKLDLIIKYMKRLMQQSVESVWSMAFDFILDNVQVVVQQTYGSTLKIT